MMFLLKKKLLYFIILQCVIYGFAFNITPPKNWQEQLQRPPSVEMLYVLVKPKGQFSPNLVLSRYKLPCCKEGKTDIDSLMRRIKGTQERMFPLYKITEKGARKINGINGAYFITTYAKGELDIAALQYFFLQGEEVVNVVYSCLVKNLEKWRPEFEKSLSTLRKDKKK